MNARTSSFLAATALAAATLAGCSNFGGNAGGTDTAVGVRNSARAGATAVAELRPTTGNSVNGRVEFAQMGDTARVTGTVRNLQPNAELGFHVHEKGDCSSGDGESAGGHFAGSGNHHGHFGAPAVHSGDLPSLRADATGTATFSVDSRAISVGTGAANDVVGHGLIVHTGRDDFTTQPSGNSGKRSACAVITRR